MSYRSTVRQSKSSQINAQSVYRPTEYPTTSPLQSKIDSSSRQLYQAKQVAAFKQATTQRKALALKSQSTVLQAKFQAKTDDGTKALTAEEVMRWYFEATNEAIPETYNTILAILAKDNEDIALDQLKPSDFISYLKERESDFRPHIEVFDEKRKKTIRVPIPGVLSIDRPGALECWNVGDHTAHRLPADLNPAQHTELAHVTYDSANLSHRRIDPNYGSNPGEFGSGFYLTTGHETQPQERISAKWGDPEKGKFPKDVVRFRLANQRFEQSVNNDQESMALLTHMLQASSGYPQNMTEAQAVAIMNKINQQGHILLFPDDKTTAVSIDNDRRMTWEEYTEFNSGPSDHYMVVGPQRPPELDGVRQVAFRGSKGEMLVNRAKRSLQKMV